jgi:hypothetical protein
VGLTSNCYRLGEDSQGRLNPDPLHMAPESFEMGVAVDAKADVST